eukprot:NODE_7060_length_1613_cov_3.016824.p1 GENE.NODE_7060_length_1613_cov_3.016824~~NODE_7060_length_1613_cov_3.016824.p1  ORF type:complete len:478 (-),score=129.21 NODE_7060_length_1613_cov_3.016824:69-1502(-)
MDMAMVHNDHNHDGDHVHDDDDWAHNHNHDGDRGHDYDNDCDHDHYPDNLDIVVHNDHDDNHDDDHAHDNDNDFNHDHCHDDHDDLDMDMAMVMVDHDHNHDDRDHNHYNDDHDNLDMDDHNHDGGHDNACDHDHNHDDHDDLDMVVHKNHNDACDHNHYHDGNDNLDMVVHNDHNHDGEHTHDNNWVHDYDVTDVENITERRRRLATSLRISYEVTVSSVVDASTVSSSSSVAVSDAAQQVMNEISSLSETPDLLVEELSQTVTEISGDALPDLEVTVEELTWTGRIVARLYCGSWSTCSLLDEVEEQPTCDEPGTSTCELTCVDDDTGEVLDLDPCSSVEAPSTEQDCLVEEDCVEAGEDSFAGTLPLALAGALIVLIACTLLLFRSCTCLCRLKRLLMEAYSPPPLPLEVLQMVMPASWLDTPDVKDNFNSNFTNFPMEEDQLDNEEEGMSDEGKVKNPPEAAETFRTHTFFTL